MESVKRLQKEVEMTEKLDQRLLASLTPDGSTDGADNVSTASDLSFADEAVPTRLKVTLMLKRDAS